MRGRSGNVPGEPVSRYPPANLFASRPPLAPLGHGSRRALQPETIQNRSNVFLNILKINSHLHFCARLRLAVAATRAQPAVPREGHVERQPAGQEAQAQLLRAAVAQASPGARRPEVDLSALVQEILSSRLLE